MIVNKLYIEKLFTNSSSSLHPSFFDGTLFFFGHLRLLLQVDQWPEKEFYQDCSFMVSSLSQVPSTRTLQVVNPIDDLQQMVDALHSC